MQSKAPINHVNSLFNSTCYRYKGIIVDPGDNWAGFYGVVAVLLTHCHFDHIYGLNDVVSSNSNVKIYTNSYGAKMLNDDRLNMSRYQSLPFTLFNPENIVVVENELEIQLDGLIVKPVFTPGHNPSCITWIVDNYIFTGDSYIPGVKTVTNLPGGDKVAAADSVARIQSLSDNKIILPGHFIK